MRIPWPLLCLFECMKGKKTKIKSWLEEVEVKKPKRARFKNVSKKGKQNVLSMCT